ncbi:hypothetical protein MTR67_051948 [Solanum verrucosum]|uniref:Tf2-1-like SH3-like domain-containing protein n=1 Tax=Solanum verrucosum TaxID=315347 RepID=A0AAF1A2J1_SOLVR|nr:hypothetical protein MTR67_051948 [Solanum verrucosum]
MPNFLSVSFGLNLWHCLDIFYPEEGLKLTQKIEVVQNWPRPTSPTDIRSFLGLDGYYKKFVERFSSISYPLTKLAQKTSKFQWPEACEKRFQQLKTRLTIALVLTLPKGIKVFVVYCDTFRVGLGDLEFQVDDWVYFKVSLMKGVMRFGKKGKLCPRYIGPYRLSKRVGNVAYELELGLAGGRGRGLGDVTKGDGTGLGTVLLGFGRDRDWGTK